MIGLYTKSFITNVLTRVSLSKKSATREKEREVVGGGGKTLSPEIDKSIGEKSEGRRERERKRQVALQRYCRDTCPLNSNDPVSDRRESAKKAYYTSEKCPGGRVSKHAGRVSNEQKRAARCDAFTFHAG